MPRIYSYVVRYDIGFAPNPYFGVCTLATCKPQIRRGAQIGDVVAGLGSKENGQNGHLVYAMRVDETLSFDQYWSDPRFAKKKPNRSGSVRQRYGDNIYHQSNDGEWVQEDGRHSLEDGSANLAHVRRDTNAPRVLLSWNFAYYGERAIPLPSELRDWDGFDLGAPLRGYRYNYPDGASEFFEMWLEPHLKAGVVGEPLDW